MTSTWADWKGKPARYKGSPGNWHTQVDPPEWAYCTVDRLEELRYEAWFRKKTLAEWLGHWDYHDNEQGRVCES